MTLFDRIPTPPNLAEGIRRRDAGMERALEKSWGQQAKELFPTLTLPEEFMAEDVRRELVPLIGPPPSCHTFASLTGWLIRQQLIVRTGRRGPSRDPGNHAHRMDYYRRAE